MTTEGVILEVGLLGRADGLGEGCEGKRGLGMISGLIDGVHGWTGALWMGGWGSWGWWWQLQGSCFRLEAESKAFLWLKVVGEV